MYLKPKLRAQPILLTPRADRVLVVVVVMMLLCDF